MRDVRFQKAAHTDQTASDRSKPLQTWFSLSVSTSYLDGQECLTFVYPNYITLNPRREAAALILPPFLYLGSRVATSSSFLQSHRITHVLSLGCTPLSTDSPVSYSHLALSDNSLVSIEETCNLACPIIDSAKEGRIIVHCNAARSRAPTVVAAYLMKQHEMTLKDALALIIRARPGVRPNPGFFRQLKELDVELHGAPSLTVDALPRSSVGRLALLAEDDVRPELRRAPSSRMDDIGDERTPFMFDSSSPSSLQGLTSLRTSLL
ncbi:putative phosphatases II [Lyophyllum shimeji]|uniref:protein-tyrosine-phosphatase n=1 Tax=Lyophyllum shimeji TaxID=47721 RepID=A0A9P3UT11_LYOSH|nr:putative phosphatases II [Lyophyllum shimeji]